jgi:putative membrane protein
MWSEIVVRYFHFIGIFLVVASLVSEHLLLKDQLSGKEINRLFKVDGIYGLGAILTLSMGLLLWLGVGKPAEFYTSNPLIHIKLTLFVVIGLLSIKPTVWYFKNRNHGESVVVDVPSKLKILIRIQLALLIALPLLGTLMSRGVGIR